MEKPFKAEKYKNVSEIGNYIIQEHDDTFVIWDRISRTHLEDVFPIEQEAISFIEENILEY